MIFLFFSGTRDVRMQQRTGMYISCCLLSAHAVIIDKEEVRKILRHLFKIGRAPPGEKMDDLENVI